MGTKIAHNIGEKPRTKDIEIDENVTFEEMFLTDSVLKGLHSCGYIRPSPIQLSAIPLGRCGLDLIVQAKSGTGKTCVFTVVALEMISVKALTTQVLIVAPTREIAVQIGQVINSVGSYFPQLKAYTFIGGINILEDKVKLSCCHIAIGTPGRLNQLVSLGHLNLNNIRLLVLDEADQLLTGQFKNSILELIKTSPLNKQILALSATYPKEVTDFLDKFMRSPSHVRLGKESLGLIGVKQFVRLLPNHPQSFTKHKFKFQELLSVLSMVSFNQCLVFSNSQLRAESICNQLKSAGWPAAFLTGGQMQKDRLQSFFDLCSYKCRILVSTDLSARGLDSEHVNLVVNMDIPIDQATYLHRIGRAGRFGSIGVAISLACEGDEWEAIRAIVSKTNVVISILQEKFDSDTVQKNVEALETVRPLDEDGFTQFIEKVNERKLKQIKMKGEGKKLHTDFENGKKNLTENDCRKNKKSHKKRKESSDSDIQRTEEVPEKRYGLYENCLFYNE
ncbi:putative ATP-dependent RNA helicase DDX20 [Armadillidium nasatum]|uniref:RNA helicase n=1 Tax=Armadillidium nasatum TaxID=96803 RepID=A0A5N5SM07_9CRUS|nr:putative ATP-dependent RNA helicase DDX20 [Armadillidium nasatum]